MLICLCVVYFFFEFLYIIFYFFFFSSRRRHTRWTGDWSSDVCSSDLGAEIRENFRVTQVTGSGDRVTGIRGAARGRPEVTETASLVIGADGKRSLVASAVGARRYREQPVRSFASYSYWSGVPLSGGELYQRPGRAVAVFPTNDELTMVYVAAPMTEFASARPDLEGHYLRTLDLCGDLGERVHSGSRAERLRTTPDQPNTFRCSHGPGWALAGDAGVVMDSVSAQGMTNALRDASYLSAAVVAGLGGSRPLAGALRDHQRRRDRAIRGMYDFTLGLAAFPPARRGQRLFLAAVAADQHETDRFLGAFAGIVPPEDYFALGAVVRVLGSQAIRRLTTGAAGHLFSGLRQRGPCPAEEASQMSRAAPSGHLAVPTGENAALPWMGERMEQPAARAAAARHGAGLGARLPVR